MDPDEALRQLRECLKALQDVEDPDGAEVAFLLERFEALDTWLTGGGFLPQAWERK